VAGGAVLAAVLAMAVGSAAGRAPSPADVWSSSVIPWSQVGDGWTLLQESDLPLVNSDAVIHPDQLLLIDPHGVKYRATPLEGHGMWRLADWDHRHQRALLIRPGAYFSGGPSTDVLQVDLRTGVEHQFTAQVDFTGSGEFSDRYGDPDGQTILLDGDQLAEYTSTGQPVWEVNLPGGTPNMSTPDGRSILASGRTGLDVYDSATGRLTAHLPAPDAFGDCMSITWQGDGKLTANCSPPHDSRQAAVRTFVFSVGGVPAPGRHDPAYPSGWATVTGFRTGSVAWSGQTGSLRAVRVDATGRLSPIAIPHRFAEGGSWQIAGSTADNFLMTHMPRLGPQLDGILVSWNPFTGRTVDLVEMPSQVFLSTVSW
jgi:hypothetical protein